MAAVHAVRVLEEGQVVAVIAVEDLHTGFIQKCRYSSSQGVGPQADGIIEASSARASELGADRSISWPFTSLFIMSRPIATIGWSDSRRSSCGSVPRRIAGRRSCRTRLRVTPPDHFLNWQQDPQSNYVARLTFPEKVHELRIEVELVAEMSVYNPFDFFLEPYAEQTPFAYEDWQLQELQPYLRQEPLTPLFEAYLASVSREPKRTIDFLVELNRKVQGDVGYVIRLDPGVQTKEQTLELRSGSCRDSTWLLVQLMRHLGLAARFVSGYLIQLTPDVAALDGPKGAAQDFTDLHAWCEVYLPGAGWIGLDPTSGLLAGEGHIPLSCTPEPSSAAPVTGAVDDCEVEFSHEMSVQRVYESPRVTKPYSDGQWDAIVAMGQRGRSRSRRSGCQVDDGWRADVRVGGRSRRRRMEHVGARADEAAARGRSALADAQTLRRGRLRAFRSGQVVSGRAAAAVGARLLLAARRRAVVARCVVVCRRASRLRLWAADAERFLRALAGALGVTDAYVQAGFEDVFYYLWRERRLPVNVDPFDAKLEDELERDRLRQVFSQKLDSVIGYALPLAPLVTAAASGAPVRGICAASVCSCSRAIRQWGIGCRWIRCRGWRRTIARRWANAIRSKRGPRLRCRPSASRSCSRSCSARMRLPSRRLRRRAANRRAAWCARRCVRKCVTA